MKILKLLIVATLVAGCDGAMTQVGNPDREVELEAQIEEITAHLSGCHIDREDAELALESCLYELDHVERRLARCEEGK